jgi:hypothetical protein
MKVKMLLPALTEATSPFWRPIKYSVPSARVRSLRQTSGDSAGMRRATTFVGGCLRA